MKKGMLLSTITMLIVLALSLTTATFAWFSVNTFVKTGDVQFTAQVAKELSISQTTGTGFAHSTTFAGFSAGKNAWNVTPTIDTTTGKFSFAATQGPTGQADYVAKAGEDYIAQNFFLMSSVVGSVSISVQFEIDATTNMSKGFNLIEDQSAVSKNYLAAAARLAIVQKVDGKFNVIGVYAPYQEVAYDSNSREIVINKDSNAAPIDPAFKQKDGQAVINEFKSFEGALFGGTLGSGETSIYDNGFTANSESIITIPSGKEGEEIEFFAYMWIEGTDTESCNPLSGGMFKVRLRFDLVDPVVGN